MYLEAKLDSIKIYRVWTVHMTKSLSKGIHPNLNFRASAIYFFLTHWIPRWGNSTVMSSLFTFMVQTPFLHPSLPTLAGLTRLWGWVLGMSESWVTQLTTTTRNIEKM